VDFDAGCGVTDFLVANPSDFVTGLVVGTPASANRYGRSQNLGFGVGQTGGAPQPFDPNAIGEYTLVYTVFEKGTDTVLAQVDIAVQTPTPGAAALAGVGGFAALRRRR